MKINKLFILLLLILLNFGCKKPLSNQEIAKQINICYKNNLLPEAFKSGWSERIVFIRCITKSTAKGLWGKEVFEEAVKESGISADIKKITNTLEIASYGVFGTPAVIVDGEVKCVGKIPTKDEIKEWISI